MKKLFKNLSLKKALYAVLTFILALCLVLCSVITVLRITFFNGSFLSDTLNSSQYYKDLCAEITENLSDLGDASGLDKKFFDDVVDEILVREDVQSYISSFYNGDKPKVNTSKFNDNLQSALDEYIKNNNIKNVSEDNLNYFSANAAKIYAGSIKIKYLSSIQDLILNNSGTLTAAIIILILICSAIVCVLLFTHEWKHKALRYIYTAVCSAGLFLLTLSASVFMSGIVGRIAIISRSLSDMYVSVISSFFSDLIVFSIVFIVISAALWVIHGRIRQKAAM